MKFDYYAASLPATVGHCQSTIISMFGEGVTQQKPISPFKFGASHVGEGFRWYWGGENPRPYFVASGRSAIAGAEFVRDAYPDHRVSRVDVCTDFDEAGGWDRITRLIEPIARKSGVEILFMGDPDAKKKTGRTMYFGSKASDVRLCVYEKGLHERKLGAIGVSENWFRVELRVKPRKERKGIAAHSTQAELWGMAKWTQRVAENVLQNEVPFIPDISLRKSSADQAFEHMLKQYASTMREISRLYGAKHLMQRIKNELVDEEGGGIVN
uniref:Replication initiation protein-like C-terminal domain-containing protein n=1 Tax=uncultured prokaryote TaxID=198431 RepID=A0A0H5Q3D8_9ZZZZ|nr:hypothetical protein [uncultured prokaryote]